MSPAADVDRPWRGPASLAAYALAGLLLLLITIGRPPVSRTQEARVLETARQMLPRGWNDWLIPRLNNAYRLQKPPLCYWLAATAYEVGGVSEGAGRMPTALIGWLSLLVVFIFARGLFDRPTALLSCAILLSCYLFYKHVRLAETDAPAMLFVTLAIYCTWRGTTAGNGWLHAAAAATAGALLAKGGPAIYPVLFIFGYAWIENRWDFLRKFARSGALATFIVLALPWYAYVTTVRGARVFESEVVTVASGRGHWDWPYIYIPILLIASAPWCGVIALGLWDSVRQFKLDKTQRLLLIWAGAILLPLCLIGNKQNHYVLTLLPPLAIIAANTILQRTRRAMPSYRAIGGLYYALLAAGVISVPTIFWLAHSERGRIARIDVVAAASVAAVVALLVWVKLRRGLRAAFFTCAGAACALMPLLFGAWIGDVFRETPRAVAADIQAHFGAGPYMFFGPNLSLPLCFNLRARIDSQETVGGLVQHSSRGTIIIAQTKAGGVPAALPARFQPRLSVPGHEQKFDLYQDAGPP